MFNSRVEFQKNANRELIKCSYQFILNRSSTMNHQCTGINIKSCDPELTPYEINCNMNCSC
jgi:hypothetical protein